MTVRTPRELGPELILRPCANAPERQMRIVHERERYKSLFIRPSCRLLTRQPCDPRWIYPLWSLESQAFLPGKSVHSFLRSRSVAQSMSCCNQGAEKNGSSAAGSKRILGEGHYLAPTVFFLRLLGETGLSATTESFASFARRNALSRAVFACSAACAD